MSARPWGPARWLRQRHGYSADCAPANRLRVEAKEFIEHECVQSDDIELALARVRGIAGLVGRVPLELRRKRPVRVAAAKASGWRLRRKADVHLRRFRLPVFRFRNEWLRVRGTLRGRSPFRPKTTRWVGRMTRPSESMLTKVIMTAASGKAGCGGMWELRSTADWVFGCVSWSSRARSRSDGGRRR